MGRFQDERARDAGAAGRPFPCAEPRSSPDERRRAIESLPPDAYDKMSYYERWTAALAHTMLQRGMITTEELARKMAEVDARKK